MGPQQSIGHYRIVSKLGEGGMGAVYRATDTRLNRDVAIKVLPAAFAADANRMQRFEREAQLLASLNHPNIAIIYGIEQGALVMELVEGEELKGPVPIDTAIAYAKQIAAGLEAAHEKGIIHRDLKRANIKVTPDGVIKLLDFGLAKAAEDAPATAGADATISPTLSLAMTQAGMILGTAAYMSPEQARGKAVDRRADIWSFGVVFFEMLTGTMLFGGGETVSDSLAAVITKEPDWNALPKDTPAHIRRLLERCLRKDPKMRLRDIGEARIALEEPPATPAAPALTKAPARRAMLMAAIAMAVLAVLAVVAAAGWWRASSAPLRPMMRFSVELGPDALPGLRTTAVISPDGTRLVYPAKGNTGGSVLAARLLDQSQAQVLAGTENGADPFFSPDGRWIGFFADNKLKKISVEGGAAFTLCDNASAPRGAAWGEDGNIIANLDILHLFRIPEAGGKAEILAKPEDRAMRTYRWPQILPGGQSLLMTAGSSSTTAGGGTGYDDANIEILSLKSGQVKTVQRGGYFGRYLPTGHLIYIHQGTLFAVGFDLAHQETWGTPVPLLQDLTGSTQGAGQLEFSQSGTLVYLSGKSSTIGSGLAWMDSTGKTQPLISAGNTILAPLFSPDGKHLAFSVSDDIWIFDSQRDAQRRLTFNPKARNRNPVWMPDGKHIVFGPVTTNEIWWIRADGSGQPERLLESKGLVLPMSISPDGRRLAFGQGSLGTGSDIWVLPLDLSDPDHPKAGKPEPFLREPFDLYDAAFSPDGRWMAYVSLESGRSQVFVCPFPGGLAAGKWQISAGSGARFPMWSRNGRELFYFQANEGFIMGVPYTVHGDSFAPDTPRQWSPARILGGTNRSLDLAPDGKRFAVVPAESEAKGPVHVAVLMNFFDEVKRRVPAVH